jgi:hypothetical protein
MDPVDVLSLAVTVAQLVRSTPDPEVTLRGAYAHLGKPPPDDRADPWAVRLARLVSEAEDARQSLLDFLSDHAGPLPLNRPEAGPSWGGAHEPGAGPQEPAPEAVALVEYVEAQEEEEEGAALDVFGEGFPAFSVAERRVSGYFSGEPSEDRDEDESPDEEADDLESEAPNNAEAATLPTRVRGLIDYPLEVPVLFEIEAGEAPWSVWDLCQAFADQYAKIYADPERYGAWGHDLTDLWIEGLLYFPEKQLLYPLMGS